MKLKTYINALQKLEEKYGEGLDVIYAQDDEGNGYDLVEFAPSIGFFDGYDYHPAVYEDEINAVCVN